MPAKTAQPVNKTEEVRKIVRRLGHEAETGEVRQALAAIDITVDDTIIRQVKREIRDEADGPKAAANQKPAKKKPLDGKEALFKIFKEQGTDIEYADAHRQLNGKGLQVGADWFNRLKQEYVALNPETPKVATAAGVEAVSAAPVKEAHRNGQHETGAVVGRQDEIPLREDQIPPPKKHGVVEMVRAGRQFIQMVGSKEEALALITEL